MKGNYLKKIASILLLILIGCNPVKQVINDKAKLDKVAVEVIRQGYCANDTTIIVNSDTIVKVDSLIQIYSDTTIINDSVYLTFWETKNYIKTFTIRDTLRSIVIDNSRVKLLQTDLDNQTNKAMQWEGKAKNRLGWLIFVFIGIGAYLKFRK